MSKRWKQRPPGSTWGDWGDDDELGRINLLTPEKVLQGVREVQAGISFCLSLPLDFPGGTALNQRRYPPVIAHRGHGRQADTFYNVAMSSMDKFGDPKYVDVWADDMVTLWLQYSTQWDSLAHAGAEFDADGDGVDEAVYYNGYRAGEDLVGPKADAKGDGGGTVLRPPPRPGAHGRHGVQGRGRPGRPGASPGPRLARRRPQDPRGDHGGRQRRRRARRHGPAPHRLRHRGPRLGPQPRPGEDPHAVPVPRRPRRVTAGMDRRLADRRRWSRTTTRSRAWWARTATRAGTRSFPIHNLCLFKLGVPLGEMWYLHELATWLRSTTGAASSSRRRRCGCPGSWAPR